MSTPYMFYITNAMRWDKAVNYGSPISCWTSEMLANKINQRKKIMGFNLQVFMDELMTIVQDEALDEQQRESALCDVIHQGYQYAKECGQIK